MAWVSCHASSYESVTSRHLTLPLEAQVAWRPTPWVGIAVYGFASLNAAQSFTGVTLSVQLGKLH